MKNTASILILALFSTPALAHDHAVDAGTAASSATPQTTSVEQKIGLKDGTVLVIKPNGDMKHFDAEGNRLRMRDGKIMTAVDGQRYMMKNDALWKIIVEKGTLHPNH